MKQGLGYMCRNKLKLLILPDRTTSISFIDGKTKESALFNQITKSIG